MTPEEKEILIKLGVVKDNKPPKPKGVTVPRPYNQLVIWTCITCGANYEQRIMMVDEEIMLRGIPTDEPVKYNVTNYRKTRSCNHCRQFLDGLTKEQLIDRIMVLLCG